MIRHVTRMTMVGAVVAPTLSACMTAGVAPPVYYYRPMSAMQPPARFALIPLPPTKVLYVSEKEALAHCGPPHPKNYTGAIACALVHLRPCTIIIGEIARQSIEGVKEHEEAHCKGWTAAHEP